MKKPYISLYSPDGKLVTASGMSAGVKEEDVTGKFIWEFGDETAYRAWWRRVVNLETTRNRVKVRHNETTTCLYVSENYPGLKSPMGFHLISTYQLDHDFTLLSEHEAKVMEWTAAGETAANIAQSVHRGVSTITATMTRIRAKLGAENEMLLRWEANEWYNADIDCTCWESVSECKYSDSSRTP